MTDTTPPAPPSSHGHGTVHHIDPRAPPPAVSTGTAASSLASDQKEHEQVFPTGQWSTNATERSMGERHRWLVAGAIAKAEITAVDAGDWHHQPADHLLLWDCKTGELVHNATVQCDTPHRRSLSRELGCNVGQGTASRLALPPPAGLLLLKRPKIQLAARHRRGARAEAATSSAPCVDSWVMET